MGIGLTLVKRLVEMHNGVVEAISAGPGQGSQFVITLPLAAETPSMTQQDSQASSSANPCGSYRLLVVDDNRDAAMTLAMLLRLYGHRVETAYDGQAALGLIPSFRPDVVFLDIGMPSLDGYELARRIRRDLGLAHLTLVALSGWGQAEDRRRSKEAGFDHHFVKPMEPAALAVILASLTPAGVAASH